MVSSVTKQLLIAEKNKKSRKVIIFITTYSVTAIALFIFMGTEGALESNDMNVS